MNNSFVCNNVYSRVLSFILLLSCRVHISDIESLLTMAIELQPLNVSSPICEVM
ncbi:MAG: hypothetical protein H6622_02450 [Halobacteriovoraceae bacterium]|nr:hypothetical protein [Halobacteriovoraceae bacterium]